MGDMDDDDDVDVDGGHSHVGASENVDPVC